MSAGMDNGKDHKAAFGARALIAAALLILFCSAASAQMCPPPYTQAVSAQTGDVCASTCAAGSFPTLEGGNVACKAGYATAVCPEGDEFMVMTPGGPVCQKGYMPVAAANKSVACKPGDLRVERPPYQLVQGPGGSVRPGRRRPAADSHRCVAVLSGRDLLERTGVPADRRKRRVRWLPRRHALERQPLRSQFRSTSDLRAWHTLERIILCAERAEAVPDFHEMGRLQVRSDSPAGVPAEPVLERHKMRAETHRLPAAEEMDQRTVRIAAAAALPAAEEMDQRQVRVRASALPVAEEMDQRQMRIAAAADLPPAKEMDQWQVRNRAAATLPAAEKMDQRQVRMRRGTVARVCRRGNALAL